jgi:hypothetical protein
VETATRSFPVPIRHGDYHPSLLVVHNQSLARIYAASRGAQRWGLTSGQRSTHRSAPIRARCLVGRLPNLVASLTVELDI